MVCTKLTSPSLATTSTGAVMVATGKGRSVAAVDPDTGTIRQVTTLGGETYGVAVGGVDGALYAAKAAGRGGYRIAADHP